MKADYSDSNPLKSNPYTGRHAPGFRFCFHVRSVAYPPLYLPLSMRQLPQIQRLLRGESPLVIFNRNSISSACEAFNDLRKQFDFPYWAICAHAYLNDPDPAILHIDLDHCFHPSLQIKIMERRLPSSHPTRVRPF